MSNFNERATVEVDLNSRAAEQRLAQLKNDADAFKKALEEAYRSGDKAGVKINTKALKDARREIRDIESTTAHVAVVMQNLDKAAPQELTRAIRTLKRELSSMERGTDAWKEKAEQVAKLQAELGQVNRQLNDQRSGWQKVTDGVNRWYYAATAAFAGAMKAVSGMESMIQAFADMDTAMADTQKFTGMSAEDVKRLNEEFKKMDTRTSREELNALASMAGRLGKQTVEDVLGFVRAGDQIKVAMDELGEDAPQIISQLAGVFNLESEMGTEKAMLSVGSAINTLSQNCAASASNLVDFSSRLGAMAAATGMTMDEMLSFGSILDANRVSVEKSATAMQAVMNKMLADPSKFAEKAGMDVEKFNEALKRSSTEGLMMFIERLSGMDKNGVAETLANLNVAGSGVTTTFVTLANKVDDVKAQFVAAKAAFSEAASVGREFAVQNETVQARLDKSKQALHEVAVTLGEKLAPMALTAFDGLRSLSGAMVTVIDFAGEHLRVIGSLAAGVAAYSAVVGVLTVKTKVVTAVTTAWKVAVAACHAVVGLMTGGLKAMKVATESVNAAMKKNVIGLVAALIATAAAALWNWIDKLRDEREAAEEARKAEEEWSRSLTDVSTAAADAAAGEISQLKMLYAAATDEAKSREERLAAARKLQELYPAVFGNMNTEDILLGQARERYEELTESILLMAKAKAAASKIEQNEAQLIELREDQKSLKKWVNNRERLRDEAASDVDRADKGTSLVGAVARALTPNNVDDKLEKAEGNLRFAKLVLDNKNKEIDKLEKANRELAEQYGVTLTSPTTPKGGGSVAAADDDEDVAESGGGRTKSKKKGKGGKGGGKTKDKFAKEESWAEQEHLANLTAYRAGEKDYEAYCARIDEIDKELVERKLKRNDLTTKERLSLTKKLVDIEEKEEKARLKAEDDAEKECQKAEKERQKAEKERADGAYEDRKMELKAQYAEGLLSEKAYKQAQFQAEIAYLQELKEVYAEGSKERADIERKIQDKLLDDQLEARRQYVEVANEIEKELNAGAADRQKLDTARDVLDDLVEVGRLTAEEADAIYEKLRERMSTALQSITKMKESAAPATTKYAEAVKKLNKELKDGIITEQEYAEAKRNLQREAQKETLGDSWAGMVVQLRDAWTAFMKIVKSSSEDWGDGIDGVMKKGAAAAEALAGVMQVGIKMMSAGLAQASQFVQANAQIEQAAIEKRYSKEIELAEGNSYRVKQLEKRRDAELARSKNEASKKQFKMKVIEAVAQMAQNIIAAVGAGMQAGWPAALVMVPLLTGMAAAQGAVQLALLKKQQKAAESTGYAEGGFTRPGDRLEEAGVVHAGEWVASQRLVRSPETRPLINALDWAQRTNTLGSLRVAEPVPVVASGGDDGATVAVVAGLQAAVARLNRRLDEPFVTVNTVTGDAGIKRAQDEYERLMKNKSRRNGWK